MLFRASLIKHIDKPQHPQVVVRSGGCEVAGAFFANADEGVLVAEGEVEGLPEVDLGAGKELHIVFIEGVIGLVNGYVAVGN